MSLRMFGPTLLIVFAGSPALAEATQPAPPPDSPPPKLRVGVSPFVPFVFEETPVRGFSIDLWHGVAEGLGRAYEIVPCDGAADKLDRLARGDLDVAIGGLTVTRAREEQVDFTHPSFRSGLAIMLPGADAEVSLLDRLLYALERTKSTVVVAFFLLVLIAGHLVWFFERGRDAFDDRYWPGVFEGVYWAIVTASTVGYGDKAPVRMAGRTLAMLVIVISLPLFAFFTAELASAFTVIEIQSQVTGPKDLKGRRVGVVRGTASAKYAASLGLDLRQSERASELYEALDSGRVDAVIYDAPTLRYHAQHEGLDKVHIAGSEFMITNLAMATRAGSPLREEINRVLLDLDTAGTTSELRVKWLGTR